MPDGKKKVYRLMLGIFLVTSLVFIYLFYSRGELDLPAGLRGTDLQSQ